jgi:hypothetical protein
MTTKTKAFIYKAEKPPASVDPNNPAALLLIPGRPNCNVKGCKLVVKTSKKAGTSHYRFLKRCSFHTLEATAKKKGMTIQAYKASVHPVHKFKKDYCENRDGRLGLIHPITSKIWKCNNEILDIYCQLEADHIHGNHNKKATAKTIQTLCVMCHRLKTIVNGENNTPTLSSSKWSRTRRRS